MILIYMEGKFIDLSDLVLSMEPLNFSQNQLQQESIQLNLSLRP